MFSVADEKEISSLKLTNDPKISLATVVLDSTPFPEDAGHCPALPARDNIPLKQRVVWTKDCKICPFNIRESRMTSVRQTAVIAQCVQNLGVNG